MDKARTIRIPSASAVSFEVAKGETVRVTNIMGQQVGDFIAFNRNDLRDKLSTSRTRSENGTIRITKGHRLYSNRNNVMLTIMEDARGVHDLLYPPCSRWVFEHRYKIPAHYGCMENLTGSLKQYGLMKDDLPDPFNIFENSQVSPDWRMSIQDPASKAGDFVEMRAETDCVVAVSACAVDVGHTNAGCCKPLEVTIT
jgi:hypothetical protein